MKIIENGSIIGREVTCASCGCRMVIEADDRPRHTVATATRLLAVLYACPQCCGDITINITDDPISFHGRVHDD